MHMKDVNKMVKQKDQENERERNNWAGKGATQTNLVDYSISDTCIIMPPLWSYRIKFIKEEKTWCCCSCF